MKKIIYSLVLLSFATPASSMRRFIKNKTQGPLLSAFFNKVHVSSSTHPIHKKIEANRRKKLNTIIDEINYKDNLRHSYDSKTGVWNVTKDHTGKTIFPWYSSTDRLKTIVKYYDKGYFKGENIKKRINLDATNVKTLKKDIPLLHLASYFWAPRYVKALLKMGANPNTKCNRHDGCLLGFTPLHYVGWSDSWTRKAECRFLGHHKDPKAVVQLLVKAGAKLEEPNHAGILPIDFFKDVNALRSMHGELVPVFNAAIRERFEIIQAQHKRNLHLESVFDNIR